MRGGARNPRAPAVRWWPESGWGSTALSAAAEGTASGWLARLLTCVPQRIFSPLWEIFYFKMIINTGDEEIEGDERTR